MLGKRTMDFKVTYLDAGLTSNYFESGNGDVGGSTASHQNGSSGGGGGGAGGGNGKVPKRYKAHLRDFLSSCRTKRSKAAAAAGAAANAANAVVNDIYAAAVTAADTPPYVYPGHPGPPGHSAVAPVGAGGYETPPSALTSYMTGQTGAAAAAALTTPYGSALYPVDNRY